MYVQLKTCPRPLDAALKALWAQAWRTRLPIGCIKPFYFYHDCFIRFYVDDPRVRITEDQAEALWDSAQQWVDERGVVWARCARWARWDEYVAEE